MTSPTRRTFFKTAGVGAVAVAGAAAVGTSSSATTAGAAHPVATPAISLPAAAKGSMVAYIRDVSTGEVSVMVEGREITVTDHQLVAKLAHALHSSSKV